MAAVAHEGGRLFCACYCNWQGHVEAECRCQRTCVCTRVLTYALCTGMQFWLQWQTCMRWKTIGMRAQRRWVGKRWTGAVVFVCRLFCDEFGSRCGIWCPSVMVEGLWANGAFCVVDTEQQHSGFDIRWQFVTLPLQWSLVGEMGGRGVWQRRTRVLAFGCIMSTRVCRIFEVSWSIEHMQTKAEELTKQNALNKTLTLFLEPLMFII